MKMTTRIAFDNFKYHKSTNILTGIAVFLTTLLLFVIPTVGKGIIDIQFTAVNKWYPSWHATFSNIDKDMTKKLAAHHDINNYGLRCDAGAINLGNVNAPLAYIDEQSMELLKLELAKGRLPASEDEIVVSDGIMEALGQQGDVGDIITIPYQINRNGELDYIQRKDFKICGIAANGKLSSGKKTYISFISEKFLENELEKNQIFYQFLFQVNGVKSVTTDDIEDIIKNIAIQFEIDKDCINVNDDYLAANYVDPVLLPAVIIIMLIIMIAGIITIYSIYYVSMNQRIQEFGRLKAIGTTKSQLKQIVLKEGLLVALIAVPAGLLTGTVVSKIILFAFMGYSGKENGIYTEIIKNNEVNIYYWYIYLIAIAVTIAAVYFSLVRPMRKAARVSEIEAMRYYNTVSSKKARRKGYDYLTIGRITKRNLSVNKKKSVITILAMAITGVFLMVVATILSCANPRESANGSIVGQYEISPNFQENDKEHPERKWSWIQQNNPMNDDLQKKIESLNGVERIDVFSRVLVRSNFFNLDGDVNAIAGIPEEYAKELEKGIIKGSITYEELKSGDKIIVEDALRNFYPNIDVGNKISLTVIDGERTYEKEVEVAAIGSYRSGLTNFNYLIMAKEAADRLCKNNSNCYFKVIADKDYDEELASSLKEIAAETPGGLDVDTWKTSYEQWKNVMVLTSFGCYAFLGILAVISVMNLINTMINSVHVRKKELGMLQAIGMSDGQLMKMLQFEGLFYVLGTLIISVGLGSLAGYPVFLHAKRTGMFEITTYHYPLTTAVIVSAVLVLIQIILALVIAKSVKKDSLIERIRFSE